LKHNLTMTKEVYKILLIFYPNTITKGESFMNGNVGAVNPAYQMYNPRFKKPMNTTSASCCCYKEGSPYPRSSSSSPSSPVSSHEFAQSGVTPPQEVSPIAAAANSGKSKLSGEYSEMETREKRAGSKDSNESANGAAHFCISQLDESSAMSREDTPPPSPMNKSSAPLSPSDLLAKFNGIHKRGAFSLGTFFTSGQIKSEKQLAIEKLASSLNVSDADMKYMESTAKSLNPQSSEEEMVRYINYHVQNSADPSISLDLDALLQELREGLQK